MLLSTVKLDREAFEHGTGWALRPEGACRGKICVPLAQGATVGDAVNVELISERLGMPIVRHSASLASLGPATFGGTVLVTAAAPELTLSDLEGNPFNLASLRGQKVVLVAWSPY